MRSLTVYFSKYGNTREVAEAISEGLAAAGPAEVLTLEKLSLSAVGDIDLLVMGTPTHRMKLPEPVGPALDGLPKGTLRGIAIAAFDTSYKMSPFLARMTAAKKLAKRLRKLGGKLVIAPETFHVVGREGPLHDGEIERAGAWAKSIRTQVEHGRGT